MKPFIVLVSLWGDSSEMGHRMDHMVGPFSFSFSFLLQKNNLFPLTTLPLYTKKHVAIDATMKRFFIVMPLSFAVKHFFPSVVEVDIVAK